MILVFGIVISVVVITGLFVCSVTRSHWWLNPATLFVFSQAVFGLGTLPLVDVNRQADAAYLEVLLSVLTFFVLGAIAGTHSFRRLSTTEDAWTGRPVIVVQSNLLNWFTAALCVFSIVLGILYYYYVGYILFIDGVASLVQGNPLEQVSQLRLAAYSGERYLAPGFVNQFKNTILPALVTYIAIRSVLLKQHRLAAFTVGVLVPITIVLLLGNGQRAPLIVAIFVSLLITSATLPGTVRRRVLPIILGAAVVLFLVSSLILGRRAHKLSNIQDLTQLASEIPYRLFVANQVSGVVGFRLIWQSPAGWGKDSLRAVCQRIPGLKDPNYVSTAAQVHGYMFGSKRGTAPLSLAGAFWQEFRWLGVTLLPFVMGVLYQWVYHFFLAGPKSLWRIMILASICGLAIQWCVGNVATLLDVGLPAVIFMWVMMWWITGKENSVNRFRTV